MGNSYCYWSVPKWYRWHDGALREESQVSEWMALSMLGVPAGIPQGVPVAQPPPRFTRPTSTIPPLKGRLGGENCFMRCEDSYKVDFIVVASFRRNHIRGRVSWINFWIQVDNAEKVLARIFLTGCRRSICWLGREPGAFAPRTHSTDCLKRAPFPQRLSAKHSFQICLKTRKSSKYGRVITHTSACPVNIYTSFLPKLSSSTIFS